MGHLKVRTTIVFTPAVAAGPTPTTRSCFASRFPYTVPRSHNYHTVSPHLWEMWKNLPIVPFFARGEDMGSGDGKNDGQCTATLLCKVGTERWKIGTRVCRSLHGGQGHLSHTQVTEQRFRHCESLEVTSAETPFLTTIGSIFKHM